jgi:hypothetical protein
MKFSKAIVAPPPSPEHATTTIGAAERQQSPSATDWHLGRPRILAANFYAATSMRNVIWGVTEPWLQCASRAPGTRFAFSFRYDYRFPEQLQFVARDRA